MSFRETLILVCDDCGNRFPGHEGESLHVVRVLATREGWVTNYDALPTVDWCGQCVYKRRNGS